MNSLDDCIEWKGARTKSGYGVKKVRGKMKRTHRLSYEWANGPIPDGMYICHHCDNPPCLNPLHLFMGTPADNSADMVNKGRARKPGTHCRKGHLLTQENELIGANGRQCRTCWNAYQRQRRKDNAHKEMQ